VKCSNCNLVREKMTCGFRKWGTTRGSSTKVMQRLGGECQGKADENSTSRAWSSRPAGGNTRLSLQPLCPEAGAKGFG